MEQRFAWTAILTDADYPLPAPTHLGWVYKPWLVDGI